MLPAAEGIVPAGDSAECSLAAEDIVECSLAAALLNAAWLLKALLHAVRLRQSFCLQEAGSNANLTAIHRRTPLTARNFH